MMLKPVKIVIVFFVFCNIFNSEVEGLKCYLCTYNQDDITQDCLNDPKLVPEAARSCNRNQNYCTIRRVELLDPKGKVQSLGRFCEENPPIKNQDIIDDTYHTYYRSCKTDLCNAGSGKDAPNIVGLTRDNNDEILLVRGIRYSEALRLHCNVFFVLTMVAVVLLYNL